MVNFLTLHINRGKPKSRLPNRLNPVRTKNIYAQPSGHEGAHCFAMGQQQKHKHKAGQNKTRETHRFRPGDMLTSCFQQRTWLEWSRLRRGAHKRPSPGSSAHGKLNGMVRRAPTEYRASKPITNTGRCSAFPCHREITPYPERLGIISSRRGDHTHQSHMVVCVDGTSGARTNGAYMFFPR